MCVDSYNTASKEAMAEFKDRGSRFIAYAYAVDNEAQTVQIIARLRALHHSARHICFAYRIGAAGEVCRLNDDGEPSGTAARLIMGAILSAGVTCVMVVVVRYFGGVLLGTSGLINAYKTAAKDAIEAAGVRTVIVGRNVNVEVDYEQLNEVMRVVKREELLCTAPQYNEERCVVVINVRLSKLDAISRELEKIEKIKMYE